MAASDTQTTTSTVETNLLSGEGIFTAGPQGTMTLDYLYDGGGFRSDLAVFSLEGMDAYVPGSTAFIQEAARRALSNAEGYVLIRDRKEGARFNYDVAWEPNFAHGQYQGIKRFAFDPGTRFAVMLIQNIPIEALANNPKLAQQFGKQAIFSIPEANPGSSAQGRIVDLNGRSSLGEGAYGMEDIALNQGSDRDYNDIVFQIMGATAEAAAFDELGNSHRRFIQTEDGAQLLEYANRGSFFSGGTFTVGEQGVVRFDYLFDGGAYESELAIFSLVGMEQYQPGSEAFIKEAVKRSLSNSTAGYRVIKDNAEGAKFSTTSLPWEDNFNHGQYKGEKNFVMNPGDEFAVLLVQHTTLRAVYDNPAIVQIPGKRVVFSIPEANQGTWEVGQMHDINGGGQKGWGAFAFEDLVIGAETSDRDFNDLVFQVRGATVQGVALANASDTWLNSPVAEDLLAYARPFKEGSFETGDNGMISFDYLYDGGSFRGELAIFSLTGMDQLTPGSAEFIKEAAQRALSHSRQGHVVMSDRTEGARFQGSLAWEGNFNEGAYRGVKTFKMNAHEQFAVMLVRDGAVAEIAADPRLALSGRTQTLFSIPEANGDGTQAGQIVDLNGLSKEGRGLYAMEDLAIEGGGSDHDYNDVVFQIRGATGAVVSAEALTNENRDFLSSTVGQEIQTYANREYLYSEGTFVVGKTAEVAVDYLFDGGGFNKSELGIFSLKGMEAYELDSPEFMQEAIRRALSGTPKGHVVIQDKQQAARFQTHLKWESNFNEGIHVGEQTFQMSAGDQFALILSQNISLADLLKDTAQAAQFGKQVIFSIPEANPGNRLASQIVRMNGLSSSDTAVFGMEDIQVANGGSDCDFNDIVFQLRGAISVVASADGEIGADRDWRTLSIGKDILAFANYRFDQVLRGKDSKDTLIGGLGNDLLEGFKGRDTLIGGKGNDILTGGNGEDIFVLQTKSGKDMITDFQQGYDVLGLSQGLSFSRLGFSGNDIFLKDTGETLATLSGFNTQTLTAGNFVSL